MKKQKGGDIVTTTITKREAIKVLMLSPFYFKLDLATRLSLLHEFLR